MDSHTASDARRTRRMASLRPLRVAALPSPPAAATPRGPTKLIKLTITTRETNPHG